MHFSTSTIALFASFIGSVLAGVPANCVQTQTSDVGFCICTTTSLVPSATTVVQTLTITTTVPTVITVENVVTISATLRGNSCYPSVGASPYSPPSPSQSPSFKGRREAAFEG